MTSDVEERKLPKRIKDREKPKRKRTRVKDDAVKVVDQKARQKYTFTKPTAGQAKFKLFHSLILLSFLVIVVAPTYVAYDYLSNRAVGQFISKSGFTVRKEEQVSSFDTLGAFTGLGSDTTKDIDLIYKYIQSQEIVSEIIDDFDFQAHYTANFTQDPFFSLRPDPTIVDLTDYWNRILNIFYDGNLGLIELEVYGFSPEAAFNLNNLIISKSTALINRINAISQEDSKRYAKLELDLAIDRLKNMRRRLTKFRADYNIIDPNSGLQGDLNVVNALTQELITVQIELDLITRSSSKKDPRISELEDKISVIERRLVNEKGKIGQLPGLVSKGYSDVVGEYEDLRVELEYAEQAYLNAMAAYETSVANSAKQSRYLAAYINPTMPEVSEYPRVYKIVPLVFIISFLVWCVLILVIYSVRDRR